MAVEGWEWSINRNVGGRFVLYYVREGVPPPGTWGQRGLVAGLDLLQMWAIFFSALEKQLIIRL